MTSEDVTLWDLFMNEKIEKLKRYFEEKENVLLAFIFGSSARGVEGEDSDLDIGVYLKNRTEEDEIWREISKIVEREVDLVVLNDAPATLVSNAFKTGIPFVIKDRKLYWNLYLAKSLEAEDFLEFAESYWRIYSRSASLIPEDKVRLLERIQFLESEYQEMGEFNALTFEEYRQDKAKRRNIERWTENVINATIDIAKIVLAAEKREMPRTYEQALSDFGIFIELEVKEAGELSTFARLRNILAHEYLDVTYERIKKFIVASPSIYEKMFKFLSKYISRSESIPSQG
jgi:uncharacterized protein YutE (UPF0331/DUF86 family)/predicted nucleotidyltransferase